MKAVTHPSESPASEDRSPKRARLATETNDLPVVGLHIALIGPSHLTRLFASSLTRADTPRDYSSWNLQDRMAIQELERRHSQERIRATVIERKYVHLYENNTASLLPNPCHIVYVVECDPKSLNSYNSTNMYHHPTIQHALQNNRPHYYSDPFNVSFLLCFNANVPAVSSMMDYSSSVRIVLACEPAIFTCWHPQTESCRHVVTQSLWKRCRLSHRLGTIASPWLYETILQTQQNDENESK